MSVGSVSTITLRRFKAWFVGTVVLASFMASRADSGLCFQPNVSFPTLEESGTSKPSNTIYIPNIYRYCLWQAGEQNQVSQFCYL